MAALAYPAQLQQRLGTLVDSLDLSVLQKQFLRSRWLDQVVWMEGATKRAQRRYYVLRIVSILGGVTVPVLVSLSLQPSSDAYVYVRGATIVLSLVTAASAALEEFFRFGDRWRHYRQTVEALKTEGWQFLQLAGPSYRGHFPSHGAAYPRFAARVEELIQRDVGVYIAELTREREQEKEGPIAGSQQVAGDGVGARHP